MSLTARGFAVVDRDQINVRTVSPTVRAAMVNWLVVSANVRVTSATSDRMIDEIFDQKRGTAEVCRVKIETIKE